MKKKVVRIVRSISSGVSPCMCLIAAHQIKSKTEQLPNPLGTVSPNNSRFSHGTACAFRYKCNSSDLLFLACITIPTYTD